MCSLRALPGNGPSMLAGRRNPGVPVGPPGRLWSPSGCWLRLPVAQAARLSTGILVEHTGSPPSARADGCASSVPSAQRPAQHDQLAAPPGQLEADVTANLCFAGTLSFLAVVTAGASNTDWCLDAGCFGAVYATMWWAVTSAKLWRPSARTLVLLSLLPVMHMLGAMGMYHWELGNLSWDVLVHLTNGFIGTLLLHSLLTPAPATATATAAATAASTVPMQMTAPAVALPPPSTSTYIGSGTTTDSAGSRAAAALGTGFMNAWMQAMSGHAASTPNQITMAGGAASAAASPAWLTLAAVAALVLVGTSLIEVIEWAGGVALERPGEGMFLRGAGDFCTAAQPCSESVDSAKDMVDNVAGMLLALVAIASGHAPSAPHAQAAPVAPSSTKQMMGH